MIIKVQLYNDDLQKWDRDITDFVIYPVEVIDKLDEEVGGAKFSYIANEDLGINQWQKIRLSIGDKVMDYFVDHCAVSNYSLENKYKGEVQLVSLIKVTQKIIMDNLCFSNDVDEQGNVTTKTIGQVLTRLNNQTFTMLEKDKQAGKLPFTMVWDNNSISFLNNTAPEFFFTGNTLFECLERIGQTAGAFPDLTWLSPGIYKLWYRHFDNPNAARHYVDKPTAFMYYSGIENHTEIIDSTVENMLLGDDKDNAIIYPCATEYCAVRTEDYNTDISKDNGFVEVQYPIHKIFKVEVQWYSYGDIDNRRWYSQDITARIAEYDLWRLLDKKNIFNYHTTPSKNSYLYYKQGEKRLENLKNKVLKSIIEAASRGTLIGVDDPRAYKFKITYIPIMTGRLKAQTRNSLSYKPISSIINQNANLVNASNYLDYLQNLTNRMSGDYKLIEIKGVHEDVYKTGDYLNDEIIVEAAHTYSSEEYVVSRYLTSKTFNRKSEFVEVDHNLRQWAIPTDNVTNRNIHYSENLLFSLNETISAYESGIDSKALNNMIRGYALSDTKFSEPIAGNPISIPYISSITGYSSYTWTAENGLQPSGSLQTYNATNVTSLKIVYTFGTINGLSMTKYQLMKKSNYLEATITTYMCARQAAQNEFGHLAYIAWKDGAEVISDENANSNSYALAPCKATAVSKSILFTWASIDNISMGVRSYEDWKGLQLNDYVVEHQQFVAYNKSAEYLQFFISNKAPIAYNFSEKYTGNDEEGGNNANFSFTFPLSNKQQFLNDNQPDGGLIRFTEIDYRYSGGYFDRGNLFKIEKDLRERILFNYQLDCVGVNNTIVYGKALTYNAICSNKRPQSYRVYYSATEQYSIWDKKGRGASMPVSNTSYKSYASHDPSSAYVQFNLPRTEENLLSYAITDENGNLLFAKNADGNATLSLSNNITLYIRGRKKEWTKI